MIQKIYKFSINDTPRGILRCIRAIYEIEILIIIKKII